MFADGDNGTESVDVVDRWFDGTTQSIPAARRFATAALPSNSPLVDDIALLVSELAANAVVHARSRYRVSVRVGAEAVAVGITDHSPVVPTSKPLDPRSLDGGRGLGIVEAVSDRWGVETIEGNGKTTWFEVSGRTRSPR